MSSKKTGDAVKMYEIKWIDSAENGFIIRSRLLDLNCLMYSGYGIKILLRVDNVIIYDSINITGYN